MIDTNNKLEIAKLAVVWTSQLGTTAIISGVVHQVTEPETLAEKAKITLGGFMIGGLVAKHVGEYAEDQFDEAVSFVTKARDFWNQRNATQPS